MGRFLRDVDSDKNGMLFQAQALPPISALFFPK